MIRADYDVSTEESKVRAASKVLASLGLTLSYAFVRAAASRARPLTVGDLGRFLSVREIVGDASLTEAFTHWTVLLSCGTGPRFRSLEPLVRCR